MLMNAIERKSKQAKTVTENGALAYRTAGKEILDFNFALAGYRKASVEEIMDDFSRVFYEEGAETAIRYLFYVRDVRGGIGERRVFKVCLTWLAKNQPEICKRVIKLVPEYGRWDDLWVLLDTHLKEDVLYIIKNQINADLEVVNNATV